jgi:hypothetical protein
MLMGFVVLNVDSRQAKPKQCGLIADRLFIPKIINASGKSFITVNVKQLGGLGATIVHHQNLAIARFATPMAMILI